MEKKEKHPRRQGLTDLMRRRRDPAGDLLPDPDMEEQMEDGDAT